MQSSGERYSEDRWVTGLGFRLRGRQSEDKERLYQAQSWATGPFLGMLVEGSRNGAG